ncbi:putative box C/D snoRNA protein SPCC613.07 [Lotus japonicus]|uniref:putative box C/D snoRNA protein SPCC613.07 n=1 Tax=Lotus japonicus TaxID=34305 RepID=UPI0025885757|nr:putative box C/D snoRNA protein SPCC613.07 [Lotus japonicus]XP_057446409.1 putative box C/D snoRNA protein SPCC613.07 [Lotus japonicus]XP_057446410.1 putative box C/D snoRNA protein SPCC613.07 [Lotus japonicus]
MSASPSRMEGGGGQVSIKPALCEECKSNASKYKCPGCSVRSCSLPCVKAHKVRTGCTGKRNRTQFVPLSQFDDSVLLSDYNLLEEVKRVAESAQRMRTKLRLYPYFKLPYPLKSLGSAAASRRTKLLFLPSRMSKREMNQTRYDQRKKAISWTIEWRFHSTDIVLHDHGVDENSSLCSILEKHLKPGPWNHQLREFCVDQIDCLKLFICKYPKGPRSPFKELDMKAPIRQQLANIVILEFPVVFVFFPSHNINFEVVKDVNSSIHKSQQQDDESNQSQEGVRFREEAIEGENSSANPKVSDLMKHVESSTSQHLLTQNMSNEKTHDSFVVEGDTGSGNLSHCSQETKELTSFEDLRFVFDPDLMDDYADLDFLDIDNEMQNELDLFGPSAEFPVPEELEEGEIPE